MLTVPNDSEPGVAVRIGALLLPADMVMPRTISGMVTSATASRRSAPPFSSSPSWAFVSWTVAVVQVPVPGLVTLGPFWYLFVGVLYCTVKPWPAAAQ